MNFKLSNHSNFSVQWILMHEICLLINLSVTCGQKFNILPITHSIDLIKNPLKIQFKKINYCKYLLTNFRFSCVFLPHTKFENHAEKTINFWSNTQHLILSTEKISHIKNFLCCVVGWVHSSFLSLSNSVYLSLIFEEKKTEIKMEEISTFTISWIYFFLFYFFLERKLTFSYIDDVFRVFEKWTKLIHKLHNFGFVSTDSFIWPSYCNDRFPHKPGSSCNEFSIHRT